MVNSGFMRQSGAVPIMLAISEGFACTVTSAFLDFLHTGVQRQGKKIMKTTFASFRLFLTVSAIYVFKERCLKNVWREWSPNAMSLT